MQNLSHARERMFQARDLGISFALDDFGTGYSSLAYLEQLPLDVLKIDRHFVTNIGVGEAGAAGSEGASRITETILSLGHHLGMDIVAEGIEHEHQSHFLAKRGCQYAQGFLWGKPLTMEDALGLCTPETGGWE
jgi:sensor c-di-GMP phosphodiesterase-like protein